MNLKTIVIHVGPTALAYRYVEGESLEIFLGDFIANAPEDAIETSISKPSTMWSIFDAPERPVES